MASKGNNEEVKSDPQDAKRRPFEEWGKDKQVDEWKVNAAKHMRAWAQGFEVTEAEFNQAVYDACNHVIR